MLLRVEGKQKRALNGKLFIMKEKGLRIKIKSMYMYQYTTNEFYQTFFHFQKYIVKSRGKTKRSTKGKTIYPKSQTIAI